MVAHDELAQVLSGLRERVVGQRVIVWGRFITETFANKPGAYEVLHLTRIQTPDGVLPAPAEVLPEPPDDVPLLGEAETEPLGLVAS